MRNRYKISKFMVLKDLKDGTVNIRKKQDGFFPKDGRDWKSTKYKNGD